MGNYLIHISIHSLRMEGDISCTSISSLSGSFQSTPSAWRETSSCLVSICKSPNFNPLPPHGGRLCPACDDLYNIFIFQSTPSAWRETRLCLLSITGELFQSTPSAWRETHYGERGESLRIISIHSLRMEGDEALSPLGEKFGISIHSLRMEGDHHLPAKCRNGMKISIHSLRMEGDRRR